MNLDRSFEPFGQPGSMPMQYDVFEKRSANKHDEPVAMNRDRFAGSRHVIKVFHPVPKSAPNRLQAIPESQQYLHDLEFADIFKAFGNLRIDMVALDAMGLTVG